MNENSTLLSTVIWEAVVVAAQKKVGQQIKTPWMEGLGLVEKKGTGRLVNECRKTAGGGEEM